MYSCSLKEYLLFLEGAIYDDPDTRRERLSLWKRLKTGYRNIGKEEAEIDRVHLEQRTSHIQKRRLDELPFVDEFLKAIEEEKVGFIERTLAWVKEAEMTTYDKN